MQLTSFITALLLATAVSAHGDKKDKSDKASKHNSTDILTASTKVQCKAIDEMNKLVDLANNDTLLADITNNNATKITKIKDKAANLTSELSSLTSNTTLMSDCAAIDAKNQEKQLCSEMAALPELQALAANTTALNDHFKGNATKVSDFQAKASQMAAKLATSQANTTLTTFCAAEDTKSTCKGIVKLQKEISKDSNTTRLNEKFNGNQTKISEEQAKIAKKQTELNTLTSNSTLMSACSALNISTSAATNTSTDGTTSADTESFAARVDAPAHFGTAALLVLLGSAMAML
ncbi:hypothetical protein F5Y16DRAFT_401111 [Xylariaceae sp. FL0255]|nr:hypothetical protein F5Y16DRAFT_401111 [Xylariaceae sp. FL0255]